LSTGPATVDRCAVCDALVDVEDLFCANCGTEIPDHRHTQTKRLAVAARNFKCRGCGAAMNYDASAQALKCPFCGSVDLAEDPNPGILAPEFVVPFAIDRGEAEGRLRAWLGSSFWHPDALRSVAQLTELRRVFVPFWVFNTHVTTHWAADIGQTPPGARANWYPVAGFGERDYADLWVPAGGAISVPEIEAILPFDPSSGVDPERVDLADVVVEQFTTARRYARPLAQQRLEALEAQSIAQQFGGRVRNIHVNVLMEGASSRAALAPAYVMGYRYRNRVYRYVLNGQNGRDTGTAPSSVWKVAGVVSFVVLIILIILLLVLRH
jgi:hypothetical protein